MELYSKRKWRLFSANRQTNLDIAVKNCLYCLTFNKRNSIPLGPIWDFIYYMSSWTVAHVIYVIKYFSSIISKILLDSNFITVTVARHKPRRSFCETMCLVTT